MTSGAATPARDDRSLRGRRDSLLADPGLSGVEFCRRYATAADEWLRHLFAQAAGGDDRELALLAVGGYGRGELAPSSDLDLVLVHDRRGKINAVAEALWYPVWDDGVHLDHSVRTLKELRATMDADFKVALGLLEARLVAGDRALAGRVIERVLEQWRTRAGRWLPELDQSTQKRHRAHGDLAFMLEPDLKEARGGLRDRHQLQVLARVSPVVSGVLADPVLAEAGDRLTAVRVELQRLAHKPANRLLLQEQAPVARALGLTDADALMGDVAAGGRAIAWASDDAWRRLRSALAGPRGRTASPDRPLEPGLVLRDGEVTLSPDAPLTADVSLAMRAAAVSAELDLPLARSTLQRMAGSAPAPEGTWPPELLRALLRALAAGAAGVLALESLDQHGLMVRVLPEWQAVRNRPQRNAYHHFTVDRHLLECAANASRLVRQVSRPDLLLLGALLHDIGKGRGGDHTEIGVQIVAAVGPRMGLAAEDVEILVILVRHHLLLADAATRRDLEDPATIATVARATGDPVKLELLAALTEADGLATGPAAWGPWKAGLVARLVRLVGQQLAGEAPAVVPPTPTEAQRRLMAAGRLELMAAGSELTVVAPDRDGLLATVAGVLALSGAVVLSASTRSAPSGGPGAGMAVLVFEVAPMFDVLPAWSDVRSDLEAALDGRLPLDQRLAERHQQYSRHRRATSAQTPGVVVITDNQASDVATVIEVRAPDHGPVLYRIARALTACGLTITAARVSTLGAEVVDAFYVRDRAGGKLADTGPAERAVAEAIVTALS